MNGRMGVVQKETKLKRRRAARWRFLLEHPEPPDIDEWERAHPKAEREEREAAEWAREEWEGLAHEKARPYFRKPTTRQAEQLRAAKLKRIQRPRPAWMKDIDWGGGDVERREHKLAKRSRRAEQRARSWRKYTTYVEDYCSTQCTRLVARADELKKRKRAVWAQRPEAGAEFDRMDRQIAQAAKAVTRCEQSCFDKELGRGYRRARGFEFTGRRTPHYAAKAEQGKYRELIHERERGEARTIAAKVRQKLEQGLMEHGGPVILPHKGHSDVQRQRAFIRFQTGLCARLKRSEKKAKCLKHVKDMRVRLKDVIAWHRDRCKLMSDKAARRECLRKLLAG